MAQRWGGLGGNYIRAIKLALPKGFKSGLRLPMIKLFSWAAQKRITEIGYSSFVDYTFQLHYHAVNSLQGTHHRGMGVPLLWLKKLT